MPDAMSRTQLAHTIQQGLLREIEHEIQVERLLADSHYARDVLLVCDALQGTDLPTLSALYREATAAMPVLTERPGTRANPGHAQQANDWGRDTSGFGLSQPPPLEGDAAADPSAEGERRRGWQGRWRG